MGMTDRRGLAFVLGVGSWTATEYLLHRLAMHEMRGRGLASKEHLKHHADVTYFAPTSKKLLSAAATTAVAYPAAAVATDRRWAASYVTGLISMYFTYELLHRRTHTHPPRGAYSRWMRRSHLHHHFGSPMTNHGVTTPVWDKAFGTYQDPGVVTVPRRMAPVWLLDADGEVRPELAADYQVKGGAGRDRAQAARDHEDAFSNVAPVA
jgi:sterol desaturase/sphingolipid hydroxylase (fatty acid hydroxylase superfamily)